MKKGELAPLERALEHRFERRELLETALTHTSRAHEEAARAPQSANGVAHNEQMEFLGDAVLGLVTTEELFRRYPNFQEGQLSKLRAHLVSEKHLIEVAEHLGLGRYLRLGHGEEKSGGRSKPALLVDALEAVIGAMYLDRGIETPRRLILSRIVEPELERLDREGEGALSVTDYKSALQERMHALGRVHPDYVLIQEEGPEHRKMFTVEVQLPGPSPRSKPEYVARGRGSTKKKAEQDAAQLALEHLRSRQHPAVAGSIEPQSERAALRRRARTISTR